MDRSYHTPVLVDAVFYHLSVIPDGIYVDGTLGGGGHAEPVLKALSSSGKLIGLDLDAEAIDFARQRLDEFGDRVVCVQDNFSNIAPVLRNLGIKLINGLVLDLGASSRQFDSAARGFSFQADGRIDMRMNQKQDLDGWKVVNTYDGEMLAAILAEYGEERMSGRIAKEIVRRRKSKTIDTSPELAAVVGSIVGGRFLQKSLARVFQAIRIEVNGELDNLKKGLREATAIMESGARLVVISYHSLEDRIVKEFIRSEAVSSVPSGSKFLPDRPCQPRLRILTKKPVTASAGEIRTNPRARSAKLRAAEKI